MPPTVRAKFVVQSLHFGQGFVQLKMAPVGGKTDANGKYVFDAENTKFWEASPSGEFSMNVQEKASGFATVSAMTPGSEFYLDITPA